MDILNQVEQNFTWSSSTTIPSNKYLTGISSFIDNDTAEYYFQNDNSEEELLRRTIDMSSIVKIELKLFNMADPALGATASNVPTVTLNGENIVPSISESWEEPQLIPRESKNGEVPILNVNIASTDKIIAKETQDIIKDENKELHAHLDNGFAITMTGTNMINDNRAINAEYILSDAQKGEKRERILDFTSKGPLTMNVILHDFLPNANPENKSIIYIEDANGNRTKISEVEITDLNRICFSTDILQKYVIVS